MILVDSSVWIDYFRGSITAETDLLDELLEVQVLAVADLVLVEVLQGFASPEEFSAALALMTSLTVIETGGADLAVRAARNHRALRAKGVTIRKTIDTLIATRCIDGDITLLFSDRDFLPFVSHLGLRSAMP